ncbi:MAG: hypothetical protein J4478_02325 [Candidatus Diapherotrites archaeon]|uniref:Uncharacterized protein n=1 Tax=Candidatus Iainarchaeum sp. TaxID=3101447 RepID=A0A7J4KT98_9ARCH|nr:MAG: hypothetical protein QT12_C0005G0002 [archaeon GW2011_AR21]MBS3058215.1 hypothetical protein [Candidatus Diapherotrites archaeon]HIH21844.1 hypothetical protein [Candidatus Diapherotrites archaeon]HIH33038.1 hypothetical protein [Candidatus Diapherotrites archaeon]
MLPLLDVWGNIWIALAIFTFVWIFSWAKSNLGSAKLAVIFALIISYITFYTNPELIWLGVLLFIFATFGKEIFEKIQVINK